MKMSTTNFNHQSIPEKVYKILAWFTNPDSKRALILYGPMASGKTVAFWEAIEQLKGWAPEQRPLPKEITLLQEGISFLVFNLSEAYIQDLHFSHNQRNTNILEAKTVILVTSRHLPHGMADILCADTLKFQRE